jgi:hypothetical protein
MALVSPALYSIQYDGTNGAQVAAHLNIATFVSDTGSVLTIDVPDYGPLEMPVGRWLLKRVAEGQESFAGILPDADYHERYVEIA